MSTYSKLGCLHEQQGDMAGAARWHAKAMGLAAGSPEIFLPNHPSLAELVEGFAALAAARGEPSRAAELLGLAHTLHGFCNAASLDVARDRCGRDGCAGCRARSARLTRAAGA